MENISLSLVAIVVLLAANGFFVAAEFALVKARGFRIEAMASEGRSAAKLTLRMQHNLEAYLAACQLGITMASLGLGWVGEPAVAALLEPLFHDLGVPDAILHTSAFIVGFLIFSSLHIVVGEQVPKTLAIRKAEPVSLWVAYPLHMTYLAVFPLNWLLNASTSRILSLFNVAEATHADVYSNDELKGMVATSEEHGELGADKAEMLRNLFEFDQRHVGRVMIPRTALKLLDVNGNADDNLAIIRDSGHSRFPLIDSENNEEIVGIVLAKDLYAAMLNDDKEPWTHLRSFCREPFIVPESQKVSRLFDAMRAKRAHLALVADEYGDLVGIITLEDLLEEIVGDIEDETDTFTTSYSIILLDDERWEADGLASLSDAERSIGLIVPDGLDANTLSGLCMAALGEMPEVGDEVLEYGYRFTVQSVENHRVGKLLIEKLNSIDKEGQDAKTPSHE
ncbi:hemolysin family protein [Sulfuriflexus mobilis]|uniref:hemolysin family protein n=1 Tax=Sulfuriflexus mobilis TaxID=1811807 RepID=UPI000F821407|nr:hemolysin family protein [Sulfuriflexus mobilis]